MSQPDNDTPARRRGRPRADEIADRRRHVVDAAYAELVERGYEGVTMLGIAERAGASKGTLYSWFGSREGLFVALIEENAAESAGRIEAALSGDEEPREVLIGFARGLLRLLTGDRSVALNRAAMASPELAEILLSTGRHTVGPLMEEYLARLAESGEIHIRDPDDAFRLLYGLIVQDAQIGVLLGETPPGPEEVAGQAERAITRFFELVGADA